MRGQEIEKEDPTIEKAIVKQELGLCDMMLGKDERNFHVWNYRNWIINTFKAENPALIDGEIKFINSKLETNFSNFSALHFKSKNLISKYGVFLEGLSQKKVSELENIDEIQDLITYGVPYKLITEELEKLKTGLFMQGEEQSLWLYHKWLLDTICPIDILNVKLLSQKDNEVSLGVLFSRKVTGVSSNTVEVLDQGNNVLEVNVTALDKLQFSQAYRFDIKTKEPISQLTIRLKGATRLLSDKERTLGDILANSIKDFEGKRFVQEVDHIIKIEKNQCFVELAKSDNPRDVDRLKQVEAQVQVIKEFLEVETDNRFAHSQLIFINESFYEPHSFSEANLKARIKITDQIVKSSENLLAKNPKLKHRFTYFLTLHRFKLQALKDLAEGKPENIQKSSETEEIKSINLSALADILLQARTKVTGNEVSPILSLFQ